MREIVKIGLVVVEQRAVLLVRKRGTRFWILPGGKPEDGESYEEALVREIREELATGVVPGTLRLLGEFSDVAANEPDTVVRVPLYVGELDGAPVVSAELDAMIWYHADLGIDDALSPVVARKIIPALRERGLIP